VPPASLLNESRLQLQMNTNADFNNKYRRADLAKSTVLEILYEEADQMRALFGPKPTPKSKTGSSKPSKCMGRAVP
jgi:hypothetical protein